MQYNIIVMTAAVCLPSKAMIFAAWNPLKQIRSVWCEDDKFSPASNENDLTIGMHKRLHVIQYDLYCRITFIAP